MSKRLIFGYCVLSLIVLVLLVSVILAVRVITLDTPETAPPKAKQSSYVIKRGDNLSAISQKTSVPVKRIEELNPRLDPLALAPGHRIALKAVSARARRRRARRRPPRPRRYVVKPGDGLMGIGDKTEVDPERLRSLNPQLDLDKLTPGMRLKLRR